MAVCIAAAVTMPVRAEEGPQQKVVPKTLSGTITLLPRATAGYVANSSFGDNMDDRVVYGLGLSLEYWLNPTLAAAASYDVSFKKWGDDADGSRALAPSLAAIYRFRPKGHSSIFLRGEVGRSKLQLIAFEGVTVTLGSYLHWRVGAGQIFFTGKRTAWRFELFLKQISYDPEDTPLGTWGPQKEIRFIGLDVGLCLVL